MTIEFSMPKASLCSISPKRVSSGCKKEETGTVSQRHYHPALTAGAESTRQTAENRENQANQILPPFFLSVTASPKIDHICG